MKNLLSLLILSCVSVSLLAQPKPAPRKATTAKRPASAQTAATAVKKPAPEAKLTATQPAATAPTRPEQPRQEQPTAAYVAPQPQATAARPTNRPATQVAPVRASNSRFQIGFRLGGNLSTISGLVSSEDGSSVNPSRVKGFHGGVVFNIGRPSFSVQPEILYTQYGIRATSGADYEQLKYSMVEVPILLKAQFGQPNLRFFINAGPVGSYTLGGTYSVQVGGQSDSQKIDMTNQGRMSFGATGGAGVSFKAGPGAVQVEARYSYLFSSNDNGTKIHPQNAMLSVGYLVPLGGR